MPVKGGDGTQTSAPLGNGVQGDGWLFGGWGLMQNAASAGNLVEGGKMGGWVCRRKVGVRKSWKRVG